MNDFKLKLLSGAAVLGYLTSPISAIAQDAEVELEPIIVENFNKDRFGEAADRNSSIYISENAIKSAENGDLKDLFAEEASVTVGGGIPIAQKIFVNGIDASHLNMTIDGTMQNNRAFHHTTANAIDPGLLKAVRVDAGVASADAGPNAIAGSVAFQTLDATDLLEEGKDFGGKASLNYDSNSNTFSEALTLYGRSGNFDLLGYVKNAQGDDFTSGGGWIIPGTAADLQSYLIKGGYTSDAGDRIEISAQALNDNALRPYRANFGGLVGRQTGTRIYNTERLNYSFNYSHLNPTDMWDPEITLGFSENVIGVPDPSNSLGTSNTLNGKVANTFTFMDVNTVTVGADFYRKSGQYTATYSAAVLAGMEETSDNVGGFTQFRLEPIEKLKLSFGARFDRQDFMGVNGFNTTVNGASGNASIAYEIVDGLTLKAGYSDIFGGIQIEDNYIFSPLWDYSMLMPARSNNTTAGIEFNNGHFKVSGGIFRTEVENARSSATNTDFESQGYNLGIGYYWEEGFAKFTYSNSDITVKGLGADSYTALDLGAPLGEVFAVSFAHTIEDYDLTIGGKVEGALDYDSNGIYTDKTIEGYTVVGLFAEYKPENFEGLSIRLEANNIFDEDYADRGTYGGDFMVVNDLSEPGRSFMASVSMKF